MKLKLYEHHKSSFGLNANLVAGMVYLIPGILGMLSETIAPFTFLIPILVYFFERKSKLVRFHALQYILMSLFSTAVMYLLIMLCMISEALLIVAYYASNLITLILFGLLVYAVYKALMWQSWRVPVLGEFASRIVQEKMDT